MRQKRNKLRIAAAALGASVVLPFTPSFAQGAPTAVAPPPAAAPAPVAITPPPVRVTPPAPVAATPPTTSPAPIRRPYTGPVPSEATTTPPAAETPARSRPAAERQASRPRTTAPAPRRAAPVPAPAAEPVAEAPAPAPAPETAAPLPPATTVTPLPVDPAPAETAPVEPAVDNATLIGLLAAGAILLLGALAFFLFRRRRAADEYYEETYYEEPAIAAAPAYAADNMAVGEPEIAAPRDADVEALAASSAPASGRPWLEFLMRPVRAGTLDDEARVEFELTVGNTGSVPAKDVRISTWMFAAGDSEMERMLIEPPADAQRSEVDIGPGDGARVDTAIALPRESLQGSVLPVVVADARYRLPDGSEGRTSASFAVGLPNGEGLEPFAVDLPSGLHEDVEARLHGEPQRV